MSNRTKILRTLVVLGIVACIAGAGVFSAFSSQTDNPGNVITAGTVTLADNDARLGALQPHRGETRRQPDLLHQSHLHGLAERLGEDLHAKHDRRTRP